MRITSCIAALTVLFVVQFQATAGSIVTPAALLATDPTEVGLSPGDVTSFGGVRTRLARNSNSSFMLKFLPLTSPTATRNGFFADGQSHSFEFNYDLLTGATSLKLINPSNVILELASLTDPAFLPAAGKSFVGFELYLKAIPATGTGSGTTSLSNMTLTTNVGSEGLPGGNLSATDGDLTKDYFLKIPVTNIKLTGNFNFDWPGIASSHSQENFRFEIRGLQSAPPVAAVPEPSTIALAGLGLGLAGLARLRRRRLDRGS